MTYSWEWLSDLAIIPVWECVLVGFLIGMIVTLVVIAISEDKK